jgi:hypothetical protein
LLEEAAMGVTMICCGHRAAVAENLVKTTVDGWTFHMMVKASELLERFDFVLVVNGHNEPALLIQQPQVMALYPRICNPSENARLVVQKRLHFMHPSSFSCRQPMMHQVPSRR